MARLEGFTIHQTTRRVGSNDLFHWSRFDAAIGQVSDADVEAFTAKAGRAEMLERLADE